MSSVPGRLRGARRRGAWALLALSASVAGAAAPGCAANEELRLETWTVVPSGHVASCQRVEVRFSSSDHARFALTHGDRVLRVGVTEGGDDLLAISSDDLDPEQAVLRLRLLGDGGGRTEGISTLTPDLDNTAPVARARPEGASAGGGPMVLDGSQSDDPDGDPLTFEWRLVDPVEGAALGDADTARPTLETPAEPATVTVELSVLDPAGAFDRTTLEVRPAVATNEAPRFVGLDGYQHLDAEPGSSVSVETTVTDPEGAATSLEVRRVAGPLVPAELADDESTLEVTMPSHPAMVAFELEATDGIDSTLARVVLTTGGALPDAPPRPAVSVAETATAFEPLQIRADETSDADSVSLWYEWRLLRAPEGSLLGDDVLSRLSGPTARIAEVVPDVPGEYELALRVADAVGFAPTEARAAFRASLPARRLHSSAVRSLACIGARVAWVGPTEMGLAEATTSTVTVDVVARVIAYDGEALLWHDDGDASPPALVARRPTDLTVVGQARLPEGPARVNAVAVDPNASRRGDLYVGTDVGTAILDVSATGCATGLGCWVGSPSTGYVHSPPSLASRASTRVTVLSEAVDEDGTTEVYLGNEAWLARLQRWGQDNDFLQAVIDLFSDGEPLPTTALAVTEDHLYVGVDGLGLVRREGDRDCGFHFAAPIACPRPTSDGCVRPASLSPPGEASAIVPWRGGLVIAAGNTYYHYSPSEVRFAQLAPDGDAIEGTTSDMAVCSGNLFVGTSAGLWVVDPREE